MIISKQATDLPVTLHASRPVNRIVARVWISNDRTLADVFSDLSAVTARIERSDHAAPVRPLPPADVPGNSARRLFDRTAPAHRRRRIPRQLLRRETFDSHMGQDARQR